VTSAYLGLGSNLGDRLANLQRAVELLSAEPDIQVVASSRVWESDPVGGPPQPNYLNAVVQVEVDRDAHGLLAAAQRVERALGRERRVRWGPRTIDVDVLIVDQEQSDDPELTLPHPRMLERAFVLLPLLELDPDPVLPDGRRVADQRLGAGATDGARPFAPPLEVPREVSR
jgi:2-amino-4-hydroxy-6-hydroxymethyldihydropteridine diphosphokinase